MISIIIPWKNRVEIYRSLDCFMEVASAINGEVILVNYTGILDKSLMKQYRALRIIEVQDQHYFNKACANNIGAVHARYSKLFFCDCDIILETNIILKCVEYLDQKSSFVTIKNIQEEKLNAISQNNIVCFGYRLTIKTIDNRSVEIIDFEEDSKTGVRNAPGLLFVNTSDFELINGYSGVLQGWGWEDQDMICRLTLGLGLTRHQYGKLLHLSHDDYARLGEYPSVSNRWESRDKMFRTALSRYDQNEFSGTYREDVETHNFILETHYD